MYQKSILNNGLRVITEELHHFHSVSLGVWLTVGSRDETPEEGGLTHFLEHMAFKGTSRRSALQIAREIDQMGGGLNAFTTKENTCFHARVLAEQLPRAVDLLSDLILDSLYRPEDLDRERQVILEEIAAQDDNPEDQVQVQFARHFWGDSSFGRPILGEAVQISRVSRDQLLAYRRATCRPEQMIVAVAGKVRHQELVDLIGPRFGEFTNGAPERSRTPVRPRPGVYLFRRDLEQVQLSLGTPGPPASDPRRFAATLLHLLLGGNMSSRLFQAVREQLGLAYNIYSHLTFFSDTGLLGISAGVGPQNLEVLLNAINRELKQLKEALARPGELEAAKEHLKGSIFLNAEDCDHLMMRLAKNEINFGHYLPLEEIIAGLMRVSAEEIQSLAQEILQPQDWALALLGPVGEAAVGLEF